MKTARMETIDTTAGLLPAASGQGKRSKLSVLGQAALAALLAIGASQPAFAQRVVKMVVPYGPGSTLDIVARSFNAELGEAMNATVIVENRAGAGGTLGTAMVAKATDNNTLLLTAATFNIASHLYKNTGYDPVKDFTGISYIGNSGFVLAIPGNLGVNTLQDYIRLLKSKPGELNYSSAGSGGATHLAMASLLSKVGATMQHIPMKATGEAINEVLAGRVQGTMSATVALTGMVNEPRIKLLAYTGAKRSSMLPDLPTVAEAGLPGFAYDTWYALLAPASMPKAEVEKVHAAMEKVLANPKVQERLKNQGMELGTMSIDELGAMLKADYDVAGKLVEASGAKVE
ncbi:Bug family tripartite tricarboxylate transporter substrate binding protein [Paracandidimonas soli]|uniref:Tripartite-type tricarboxylate transporter receptor subunit TctC n=1 Tax=Paracandidimonas soli TaxID=1917182 RepID=A0A4R3UR59_9BURK|nr:tripartite tricarboxylate transporter substrate-binding protein [Paracandidimonas soli]TCU93170.1 tripartite-type tricarboxylate transporter receptor subunit TctC [Paracandidimonas soli]